VIGYQTVGYKLMRLRKDGTLGPLFINARQRVPIGVWLPAEDHPTTGYKHRPGWHVLRTPNAPHLSKRGRVWVKVEIRQYTVEERPANQGGIWYLAKSMRVLRIVSQEVAECH